MRIIRERPPNFDDIVRIFPAAARIGVMFTYGEAIYATDDQPIPSWIVAHEEVHSLRQAGEPDKWWGKYLIDQRFRFEEEAVAHKIEWTSWLNTGARNRHERRYMMACIAGRLSGPLYGKLATFNQAREIILGATAI